MTDQNTQQQHFYLQPTTHPNGIIELAQYPSPTYYYCDEYLLMPNNGVYIDSELPALGAHQAYALTGEKKEGSQYYLSSVNLKIIPDHRADNCFDTTTGLPVFVQEIGELPEGVTNEPRPDAYHLYTKGKWVKNKAQQAKELADAKILGGKKIDTIMAELYEKYSVFTEEYKLREQQALDFKANNYQGEVPAQVAAYATPARVTPKAATDLILSQAAKLREALAQAGVVRMKKAALNHCDTLACVNGIVEQVQQAATALKEQL